MRSRILSQVAADHDAFGRGTHASDVRRRTHISVAGPKGPNSRTGGPLISTPSFSRTGRQKGLQQEAFKRRTFHGPSVTVAIG